MSVGVLLVSHGRFSQILLDTVQDVLGGGFPLRTAILEIRRVRDTAPLVRQGEKLIDRLNDGDGVLVLTDAFGSTPSNIANRVAARAPSRVVAGLNLPMLIKVFNYSHLPLPELARAAVEGGRRGVMECEGSDA
ncbi:MAG: PTS sugar transporter subunit IIA [Oceanococcaceae bacterium]